MKYRDEHSELPVRVLGAATSIPAVQLLSNGRYHAMVTNAGGGYSRWNDIAVTRWHEDSTRDNWGTFCYLRDVASGAFWSTTFQPTLHPSAAYHAIFSEAYAAFHCSEQGLDTHTQIAVSPEDDIEVRRISITNRARVRKVIDLTSYAEVVIAKAADDAAHPAYSNLFVQTEIIREQQAILCNRRSGALDYEAPWMFHLIVPSESVLGDLTYETDRMRFIGRGNTVANPQSMRKVAALSGSDGSVLDPIVAIQCRILVDQEQSETVAFVTGIAETRDACLTLIEKYRNRNLTDRVFDLASTHSQSVLRHINATEADAQLYSRLADSIIYANATLRADPDILIKNRRGQSGLWGNSISGDLPIVLFQIGERANINLVRQLVQAHAYWLSRE
jgi:cellobiose phosphorylase